MNNTISKYFTKLSYQHLINFEPRTPIFYEELLLVQHSRISHAPVPSPEIAADVSRSVIYISTSPSFPLTTSVSLVIQLL